MTIFGLVRPPGWRATTRVLIVALLAAGICWYLGADVWHAILLGAALAMVGLLGTVSVDLSNTDWRDGGRSERHGARKEVEELSWSLRGSYGRVDRRAVSRVRRLARYRLARHQLDLLAPDDRGRIEQLIGRRAYTALAPGKRRPPTLRALLHCLDALEALDPTRPTTSASSETNGRRFSPHTSKESP